MEGKKNRMMITSSARSILAQTSVILLLITGAALAEEATSQAEQLPLPRPQVSGADSSAEATTPSPAIWIPWEYWQPRRQSSALGYQSVDEPVKKPKKGDKSAPLDVTFATWLWVPVIVVASFVGMLLSTKKLAMLGGLSLRIFLMRYVSVETIYSTMEGMDAAEFQEQRDAEWGQQAFSFIGAVFMVAHKAFNPNSDERPAFVVLTNLQIALFFAGIIFDCYMIRAGYLRSVRSLNTKLRWSHCVYQMVLFISDLVGGDLELPVDCFIWATVHYSYEAVGLALWALNVDGMSEMAIIALLNAKILQTSVASTGWTCAFGLCALTLSCVSLVVGMAWKYWQRVPDVHPQKSAPGVGMEKKQPNPETSETAAAKQLLTGVVPPERSNASTVHQTNSFKSRSSFFFARQRSRTTLDLNTHSFAE